MTTTITTIETLQSENRELRRLLRSCAISAHAHARKIAIDRGDVPEHRGDFENCPSPVCVEVKFALDRGTNGKEGIADD